MSCKKAIINLYILGDFLKARGNVHYQIKKTEVSMKNKTWLLMILIFFYSETARGRNSR